MPQKAPMPKLETIIASILYLMTKHGHSPKSGVTQAIADHLKILASHPSCGSQVLKEAGQRLAMIWQQEVRIKQLGLDDYNTESNIKKPSSLHQADLALHRWSQNQCWPILHVNHKQPDNAVNFNATPAHPTLP